MENLTYDKKNHFLDSVSVWIDLDSFVYIILILLLAWSILNLICKSRKKKKINLIQFAKKYMLLCSVPVFILFVIQLIMSNIWTKGNIIITFLPLLYGAVTQTICMFICRK